VKIIDIDREVAVVEELHADHRGSTLSPL